MSIINTMINKMQIKISKNKVTRDLSGVNVKWTEVKRVNSLVALKEFIIKELGMKYQSEPSTGLKEGFFGIKGREFWDFMAEII